MPAAEFAVQLDDPVLNTDGRMEIELLPVGIKGRIGKSSESLGKLIGIARKNEKG